MAALPSAVRTTAAAVPPPAAEDAALRVAVLDAAARLYVERGVDRVGMAEIAAAAGIEPRALRGCYGSREHLLLAVQERFVQAFCARAHAAMERCAGHDWSGRLRAWVREAVHGYLDDVALHDAIFHAVRTHDRQVWQDNPVVEQLVELLEAGIRARVWAAPDPHMTAVIFCSAMHSAVDRVIACGPSQDDPELTRHRLVQTLIGYFERSVQWWTRF